MNMPLVTKHCTNCSSFTLENGYFYCDKQKQNIVQADGLAFTQLLPNNFNAYHCKHYKYSLDTQCAYQPAYIDFVVNTEIKPTIDKDLLLSKYGYKQINN